MKILWTLWILSILSFCERVSSMEYNVTQDKKSSCRFAQLKCSYRTGCGSTLQSFIMECDGLIHNRTTKCSDRCKNTLIGLTSTPEGQNLMNCDCDGDAECLIAKRNIEACREPVIYAVRNDTIVSCTEARWICSADAECGKALEYYHLFCRSMFRGDKCSQRCKNSLNILRRQSKAAKLRQCQCQDNEQIEHFLCSDIKENMESLCFDVASEEETTTTFDPISDNEIIDDDIEYKVLITSGAQILRIHLISLYVISFLVNNLLPQ